MVGARGRDRGTGGVACWRPLGGLPARSLVGIIEPLGARQDEPKVEPSRASWSKDFGFRFSIFYVRFSGGINARASSG